MNNVKTSLIHLLVLSCKQATLLIEKRAVIRLSGRERFQLRLHLRLCDVCSRYEHQSALLDQALQALIHNNYLPAESDHLPTAVLKAERKAFIIKAIEQEGKK